jgi:hypothetical protein
MKPQLQKAREKVRETNREVMIQTATLMNSAFALVAALAWNEALKALIERYIPAGSTLYSQVLYALVLTVIVVLVSMRLTRIIRRLRPEDETAE